MNNNSTMKVKQLIELLKAQDPEKEVMIQQGEEYDYMRVHSVRVKELANNDCEDLPDVIDSVVIEYQ